MRVYFNKSGGFAPIFQGCVLDSTNSDPALLEELASLIEKSGIMQMASKRVPQARDVFIYGFEIELDDGRKNKLSLDQLSVPDEVKPLLEFLLGRSKNMMPD